MCFKRGAQPLGAKTPGREAVKSANTPRRSAAYQRDLQRESILILAGTPSKSLTGDQKRKGTDEGIRRRDRIPIGDHHGHREGGKGRDYLFSDRKMTLTEGMRPNHWETKAGIRDVPIRGTGRAGGKREVRRTKRNQREKKQGKKTAKLKGKQGPQQLPRQKKSLDKKGGRTVNRYFPKGETGKGRTTPSKKGRKEGRRKVIWIGEVDSVARCCWKQMPGSHILESLKKKKGRKR